MLKNNYITNASISVFLEESMIKPNRLGQRSLVIDSYPEWTIALPDQFHAKEGHYLLVCTLVNKIWELSFWKKIDGLKPMDQEDLPLISTSANNERAVKNTSKATHTKLAPLQNGTKPNALRQPVLCVKPPLSVNKGLTRSTSLPVATNNSKLNSRNEKKQQSVVLPQCSITNKASLPPPVSTRKTLITSQQPANYKATSTGSVNPPAKPSLSSGFIARSNTSPNDLQTKAQPSESKKGNRIPIIPKQEKSYINPMICKEIDDIPF